MSLIYIERERVESRVVYILCNPKFGDMPDVFLYCFDFQKIKATNLRCENYIINIHNLNQELQELFSSHSFNQYDDQVNYIQSGMKERKCEEYVPIGQLNE